VDVAFLGDVIGNAHYIIGFFFRFFNAVYTMGSLSLLTVRPVHPGHRLDSVNANRSAESKRPTDL